MKACQANLGPFFVYLHNHSENRRERRQSVRKNPIRKDRAPECRIKKIHNFVIKRITTHLPPGISVYFVLGRAMFR